MELKKIFKSDRVEIEDGKNSLFRIRLSDLTNTNNLVSFGEFRFDNSDSELDGQFVSGDEFEFFAGYSNSPSDLPGKIFTGIIRTVRDDGIVTVIVDGMGKKCLENDFKGSFSKSNFSTAMDSVSSQSGLERSISGLGVVNFHSLTLPKAPVSEQLQRLSRYFDPTLSIWVDYSGVLNIKPYSSAISKTDIIFEYDEMRKFDDLMINTVFDPEIKVFDSITVGEKEYLVTNHRTILDERRSQSVITVAEI